MVTKELTDRIGELSRKQRSSGLTDEERIEQADLRRQYIDAIRGNLQAQLKDIRVVTPEEYDKLAAEGKVHPRGCACGCQGEHRH